MLRKVWNRIKFRLHRRDINHELDQELRFHLEMQIEQNLRGGLSPREARRAALLQFGGIEQVRMDCRDAWVCLDLFRLDLIHAFRSMRARPGATAAIIGVLVLGIGLTTAMFTLADPFLMRPLPYAKPEQLAVIECSLRRDRPARSFDGLVPTIQDLQANTSLFQGVSAYGGQERIRMRMPNGTAMLTVIPVSENFFDVLGVWVDFAIPWRAASLGAERPVAVSVGWQSQTQGLATRLLGSSIATQNAGSVRIGAVLPSAFLFPNPLVTKQPDAVSPATFGPIVTSPRKGNISSLTVIARLQPGVMPRTAQTMLSAQVAASPVDLKVQSIATYMNSRLRPLALGGIIAALMISLACSANVANLLIARGAYRTREFAMREALGASRTDLLRLVFVELSAVTSMAILLSLALARLVLAVMMQVIPGQYTALGQPAMTLRSVAFACVLGVGSMFAGIVPVWVAWRSALPTVISRALVSESRKVKRLRFFLAASQSATAMTLLVGGAMLVRSYINLQSQDTGFSGNVAIISVSYPLDEPAPRLAEDINATTERLRRIPGVTTAAAASGPLLDTYGAFGFVRLAGRGGMVTDVQITPGFFDTVGTALRAGRWLEATDHGWNAVVINETFTRVLWPNAAPESVIGQVGTSGDGGRIMEIVGVVRDTRDKALDKSPAPRVYRPIEKPDSFLPVNYVMRLHESSTNFEAAARRAIAAVNADAVVTEAGLLRDRLAGTVKARSFATLILSLFAIAGLGITASGLFGIVAFVAARRTREIAIRRAVGAQARHVIWVVVREAVTAATFGSVSGLLAGRWMSGFLQSRLYNVSVGDAGSFAAAAIVMIMVVAIAALLPAQRALRLSPTEALRLE